MQPTTDTADLAIPDLLSSPDPGLPVNPAGLAGPAPAPAGVTVFYDGACPLCTAEIGLYRRRRGAERIDWVDVSACAAGEVAPGLSREQAQARFHVRTRGGQLISGGRAFAALWTTLPGLRWIGQAFQGGAPAWLLDRLYELFLPWRPALQRLARRRTQRLSQGMRR